jgi:hypothetical protein
MRVPDYMLNCVGFVGEYHDSPEGEWFDSEGSGFFVNMPSAVNPAYHYFVFVTAKHVAKGLENRETVITVNKKGGGITVVSGMDDLWYLHPDESVDVAVITCVPTRDLDIKSVPIEMFVNDEILAARDIGIGDETYMPGLFSFAANENRNTPILRHGNIAMMPPHAIQVDEGFAEVYLIEARSIGGMSGSPVFVRGTTVLRNSKGEGLAGLSNSNYLLGLIHGHWDIKESELNSPRFEQDRKRGVNLGIAVVVPAKHILDVINHPGLVAQRNQRDAELKASVTPGPDQG